MPTSKPNFPIPLPPGPACSVHHSAVLQIHLNLNFMGSFPTIYPPDKFSQTPSKLSQTPPSTIQTSLDQYNSVHSNQQFDIQPGMFRASISAMHSIQSTTQYYNQKGNFLTKFKNTAKVPGNCTQSQVASHTGVPHEGVVRAFDWKPKRSRRFKLSRCTIERSPQWQTLCCIPMSFLHSAYVVYGK